MACVRRRVGGTARLPRCGCPAQACLPESSPAAILRFLREAKGVAPASAASRSRFRRPRYASLPYLPPGSSVLLHSSLCRGLGSLTTFLPIPAPPVKNVIHYEILIS